MQTLKTAAIVVLLMTVMYGAYVSLTTPPEPLPDDVEQILIAGDEFGVESGFADSPIASFGIDEGSAEAPAGMVDLGKPEQAADAGNDAQEQGVTGTLSDDAMTLSANERPSDPAQSAVSQTNPATPQTAANSPDLLEGDRVASLAGVPLPPVGSKTPSISIDQNREYPSTGNSFAIPETAGAAKDQAASPPANASQAEADDAPSAGLANAIRLADEQYGAGKKKEALATLSVFYDVPDLSAKERTQLLSRLDPLAREVIYSRDHFLEQPHRVGKSETLMDVAKRYEVPWQLLANINGVDDPVTVLPGTELKVIRGPFRADIDLSQSELTLFISDYYAGRFPVGIGSDPAPKAGTYTIQGKQSEKTYYNAEGIAVPPGNAENPYGDMWLDLGGQLCLHGSPSESEPTTKGCISLSGAHAADLQAILSKGSSVVIRP